NYAAVLAERKQPIGVLTGSSTKAECDVPFAKSLRYGEMLLQAFVSEQANISAEVAACEAGESTYAGNNPNANSLLKDKVVLLGGTYDNLDQHRTPFGDRWGVDLIASATELMLVGK